MRVTLGVRIVIRLFCVGGTFAEARFDLYTITDTALLAHGFGYRELESGGAQLNTTLTRVTL